MHTCLERWLPRLFQISIAVALVMGVWQCRNGWPISTDLQDLLPPTEMGDLPREAQLRIDQSVARQLIALVGAPGREQAVEGARLLGNRLRTSGLFEHVQVSHKPDLTAARQALLAGRIAMLPARVRNILETDPANHALARAREISDPFSLPGAIPLDQDWLGLTVRIQSALRPPGQLQYDAASGTLQAEQNGITWVLVSALPVGTAFDSQDSQRISGLLNHARDELHVAGCRLLVTGGVVYAAAGREQAARESLILGTISALGIAILLLLSLGGWQVMLGLLPVAAGLLCGFVACVAVFGRVHGLTIVIGTSLIGLAVDFPLHWMGKIYGADTWRPWPAMRRVIRSLSVSLATSLVGYVCLGFAPFPALTQVAVFSVAGLLAAYLCTVCQMPVWLSRWQPRPNLILAGLADSFISAAKRVNGSRRLRAAICLAFVMPCAIGAAHLDLRDDLRQWMNMPESVTAASRQIGEVTGFMPTSQFLLVRAPDDDTLLQRLAQLDSSLDTLTADHWLASYLSLSQIVSPIADQRRLMARFSELASQDTPWQALTLIGIPLAAIQAEVRALAMLPTLGIDDVMANPLAEPWRSLWLGRHLGESAAIVTLQGLRDVDRLRRASSSVPGVTLVDRPGELNSMFSSTRRIAALFKLVSYGLAAFLLWSTYGKRSVLPILSVPMAATLATIGALGYLGQPVTLFSLFGLLLVSTIGVDYAIFMYEQAGGPLACMAGILLAGASTLLSFGMLAFSSTPAVASFGLTVALGVFFCLCLTPLLCNGNEGFRT